MYIPIYKSHEIEKPACPAALDPAIYPSPPLVKQYMTLANPGEKKKKKPSHDHQRPPTIFIIFSFFFFFSSLHYRAKQHENVDRANEILLFFFPFIIGGFFFFMNRYNFLIYILFLIVDMKDRRKNL